MYYFIENLRMFLNKSITASKLCEIVTHKLLSINHLLILFFKNIFNYSQAQFTILDEKQSVILQNIVFSPFTSRAAQNLN